MGALFFRAHVVVAAMGGKSWALQALSSNSSSNWREVVALASALLPLVAIGGKLCGTSEKKDYALVT